MILDERDVFNLFAKSLNEFGGSAPRLVRKVVSH